MIRRSAGPVLAAALLTLVTLVSGPPAMAAPPADPKSSQLHLFGVWPNRLRLFDEATEEFVGDIGLKYGAATNSTHSPDFSKFYFVTDRMEAVEVVDLKKRAVVDTVKLSAQSRQIRIANVAVNPAGTLLYVVATPVVLEIDRFLPEESEVFVYDLENKRLQDSFKMPRRSNPADSGRTSTSLPMEARSSSSAATSTRSASPTTSSSAPSLSRSPFSRATGPSGAPG